MFSNNIQRKQRLQISSILIVRNSNGHLGSNTLLWLVVTDLPYFDKNLSMDIPGFEKTPIFDSGFWGVLNDLR